VDALRFPVAFPYPDTLVVRGTPYRRLNQILFEPDFALWQTYAGVFVDPFTPFPDESAIHVHYENEQLWINNNAQEALSNSRFVSSDGLYEFIDASTLQVQMGTRFVRPRNNERSLGV
jgi:hypothetical protein